MTTHVWPKRPGPRPKRARAPKPSPGFLQADDGVRVNDHHVVTHVGQAPLDDERFTGASILFSGSNFGCGSSREHAPQALYRFGIRAIIAESFAEIFFGNSITLGMPCVVMTGEDIRSVAKLIESDPAALLTLDLTEKKLSIADMDLPITIAPHAHEALVTGKWDAIADLLEGIDAVRTRAATLPYMAA